MCGRELVLVLPDDITPGDSAPDVENLDTKFTAYISAIFVESVAPLGSSETLDAVGIVMGAEANAN